MSPPPEKNARAPWLVHAAVLAGLGLALGKALLVDLEASGRSLLLGLVLVALTEACVPWRERGPRAQARRGLQAGLLAANALLVGAGSPDSWGERVTLVLGGLTAVATTLALARAARSSAPGPEPASPGVRRALGLALVLVLGLVGAAVLASALVPAREVALDAQAWRGQDHLAAFPRFTLARLPDEAVVLEDGQPLARPEATQDSIAKDGSGRYQVLGGRYVHFSSSDGTDPLRNGRRYAIAFVPDLLHSAPVVLLAALALGLALLGAGAGAVSLEPSGRRARAGLLLALALAGTAQIARAWDRVTLCGDSDSYLLHSPTRSALYPALADLFDARPQEPRVPEPRTGSREDPGYRFSGLVRAQRATLLVALLVLVWEATSALPLALVAILVWVGWLADLSTWADRSVHLNAGTVATEAVHQALVFLYVALVLGYARRPGWARGVALAAVLALTVLTRPASSVLLLGLGLVFVLDARALGWRPATKRGLVLALVYALPILAASLSNYERFGFFRIHALTGPNVFGTAFELADESDPLALEDPRQRRFLELCLASPTRRLAPDNLDFPDHNIYAIGLPTLALMPEAPRGPAADFEIDDWLLAVGKKLIARHPLAYARQVAREVGWLLDEATLPLLACLALALVLFRRTGERSFLAYAFLASLPLVFALPACFFHVPKGRYRSPTGFLECAFVPLLAVLVVALRREFSAGATVGTTAASPAPARSLEP